MLIIHLERDERGRFYFRAEAPEVVGDVPSPMRTTALLTAVRSCVWYRDGFTEAGGRMLYPNWPNLLMFLSDVRGPKFRKGIFLAQDVLDWTKKFRTTSEKIVAGQYLPMLVRDAEGVWHAKWELTGEVDNPFADAMIRRAGVTPLEAHAAKALTVHDAWLTALRNDDDRVAWQDEDELEELAAALQAWRMPFDIPSAERAALSFELIAPKQENAPWLLKMASAPKTREGIIALGQAAAIFPPLRHLRKGVVELNRADALSFLRIGAQALSAAAFTCIVPKGLEGEHIAAVAELKPIEPKHDDTPKSVSAKLTIRIDGEEVDEQELQFLYDQGTTLVFFHNRWIEVDRFIIRDSLRALQQVKERKLSLMEAVSFSLGTQRVGRLRIAEVKARGWLRGLLNELHGKEDFALIEPPVGLKGELRDYQLRGASFLAFLVKWGFGPCLADDMGLGKTIQTIAWILHSRQAKAAPVLVVAPVSVTMNWQREFHRFAPSLKVYLHQGTERAMDAAFREQCMTRDVIITGYSLLVKDIRMFMRNSFSALVIDEAQTVKNPDTRVAKTVRSLGIPVRVALTGTPLENSPTDLWSLEEFLNPGLLGLRADFEEDFTKPLKQDSHSGAAVKLRRILEPFLLRRLKSDPAIAAELGAKREVREYCPLTMEQRRLYENALEEFRLHSAANGDARSHRGRILALLTELKQICDTPALKGGEEDSGKLQRLDELLGEIFETGESCLIFTQYAKMGELLRSHLQEVFGRRFPFLYGALSATQRDAEIKAFNADPQPNAFILSLKAGGFGLNLIRATHVIHFDRWWNPAVENQATDRAHRIGQKRTVFVHTFICAGTLEDRIDELMESKRHLASGLVTSGESFLAKMSEREFESVVALAKE